VSTPLKSIEDLQREILQEQLAQAKIERQAAKDAADEERRRREAASKAEQQKEKDAAAQTPAKSEDEAAKRKKELEERRKAVVGDLQGIQTGIANLTGASLTLPEKTVFREALVARAALEAAAAKVATMIHSKAGAGPVLITARTDQAETVLAALAFQAVISECRRQAADLLKTKTRKAGEPESTGEVETTDTETEAETTPAASADSLLGVLVSVGVAALNAISVETTIEASTRTATELETHIAVMGRLLDDKDADGQAKPPARVVHDSLGIPPKANALLTEFQALRGDLIDLQQKAEVLKAEIARLDAKKNKAQIARLESQNAEVAALAAQIASVIEAANTADAATGSTPLRAALGAYALVTGGEDDPRYIAIVPAARLNSHQTALKRRLFAPRLIVTASAEIDVVVLDAHERRIVAAGTHAEEAAFQVRFPMWWWGADDALAPKYKGLKGKVEV
jgi:hypothetical protein